MSYISNDFEPEAAGMRPLFYLEKSKIWIFPNKVPIRFFNTKFLLDSKRLRIFAAGKDRRQREDVL